MVFVLDTIFLTLSGGADLHGLGTWVVTTIYLCFPVIFLMHLFHEINSAPQCQPLNRSEDFSMLQELLSDSKLQKTHFKNSRKQKGRPPTQEGGGGVEETYKP